MSGDFDPYFKWLSIPPEQQPPNHYRLLGAPEFVDDVDVIENAADKQTLMLRTLGTGQHAPIAQRLLNEVTAAKLTLLDPGQKTVYDSQLRLARMPTPPAAPRTRPAQPVLPTAIPVQVAIPQATTPASQVAIHSEVSEEEKPSWQQPLTLIIIGSALAAVLAIGVFLAVNSQEEEALETAVVEPAPVEPTQTVPKPPPETKPGPKPQPEPEPQLEVDPPDDLSPLDLLSQVDIERHSLTRQRIRSPEFAPQGDELRMENDVVVGSGEGHYGLHFPCRLPAQYDLNLVLRRTSAEGHFSLVLDHDGQPFQLVGTLVGCVLSQVDDRPWNDGDNPTHTEQALCPDEQPHSLIVQVRDRGLNVLYDGQSVLQWTEGYERLSLDPQIALPEGSPLSLIMHNLSMNVEKIELVPMDPSLPIPQFASLGSVDLLSQVDLKKNIASGKWRLKQGVLQDLGTLALLQFDNPMNFAEYDVTMVMKNTQPRSQVMMGLVSPYGQLFNAGTNTWLGSGLGMLNGRRFYSNLTSINQKLPDDGELHTLEYHVRKTGIDVMLDGKFQLRWRGDFRRFTLVRNFRIVEAKKLFLNTWNIKIEKLELRPLPDSDPMVILPQLATPSPQLNNDRQGHPAPREDQQRASLEQIKDVFQEEYRKARSNALKSAFAKNLHAQSVQSRDDLTARYVFHLEALRLATDAGDIATALSVAMSLERVYDIPPKSKSIETLKALSKVIRLEGQRKYLAERSLTLLKQSVKAKHFNAIDPLIALTLSNARAAGDEYLYEKALKTKKRLAELGKAYIAAERAMKTLEENPDHPLANLNAGRYFCFMKNHWQLGLLMLSKGSDKRLKAIADAELANPQEVEEIIALGDHWSKFSDSLQGTLQEGVRERAAAHYRQAVKQLEGLARTKVEMKIRTLEER